MTMASGTPKEGSSDSVCHDEEPNNKKQEDTTPVRKRGANDPAKAKRCDRRNAQRQEKMYNRLRRFR